MSVRTLRSGRLATHNTTVQHDGSPCLVVVARSFPATADQVSEARRFLAAMLGDFPAAEDAVLCLSELATNAITHSNSARPGGQFTVRASLGPAGWLRVEVEDDGGPWHEPGDNNGQRGRGLMIVRDLARHLAITGDGPHRTVSFEIGHP